MYGQPKNDWRIPKHRSKIGYMLHAMEGKIGIYRIEIDAYVLKWSWHLLPSIVFAFDEVGVYFSFGFLCLHTHIQIEDEVKEHEWNERIGSKFASLTNTDEDEAEEED